MHFSSCTAVLKENEVVCFCRALNATCKGALAKYIVIGKLTKSISVIVLFVSISLENRRHYFWHIFHCLFSKKTGWYVDLTSHC